MCTQIAFGEQLLIGLNGDTRDKPRSLASARVDGGGAPCRSRPLWIAWRKSRSSWSCVGALPVLSIRTSR
jgi:hypothetical protein